MNQTYSIGVIGGADGPTAILITGEFPWEVILLCVIFLGIAIWYFKRKK